MAVAAVAPPAAAAAGAQQSHICTRALGRSRFAAALHGRAPRVLSGRCSVHGRYARPHSLTACTAALPPHAHHPPSLLLHTQVLRRALDSSPIGRNEPLACLKARTMYAEDKRFFPDSLPPTLGAIDELWSSYSGHLGDTTFWGPRDRLRCFNKTAPLPPQAPTQQQLPATAPTRPRNKPPGRRERNNNQNGRTLIAPSAALGCMEMIRGSLGARSKLFVAVDAPRLQETIFR